MTTNNSTNHQTGSVDSQKLDALGEIEVEIAKAESNLKSARSRTKTRPLIWVVSLVTIGLLVFFGRRFWPPDFFYQKYLPVIGLGMIGYGIFGGLYLLILTQSRVASYQSELDVLNARKRILNRFAESATAAGEQYFDSLVRINVENLAAYYALVKVHTDKSFMVSIAVGIIGFILIITGLVFGFAGGGNAKAISYIASGSGIITEFIAGVFFYLYNRTVRQMKEYHDSLLSVQNILLSFKIVGDTKDETEKAKMVGTMVAYLVGKETTPVTEAKGPSKESAIAG